MNHKQSLLGVGMFYTVEEALTLHRDMSDFEDESTSENEIEGDSSDSSEYAPEQQYQVRTDSNIQTSLPKEIVNQNATKHALLADETSTTSGEEHVASPPKVSKAKEIPAKGQKAAPKLIVNQNATKHALLADETATTSGEEHVTLPPNISKAKEIPAKGQKAAPKLIANQNATKCALLADETATTSSDEHVASPPKVSKVKKIPQRVKKLHQNWLLEKGKYPKKYQHCMMKEPWHLIVIWMEKTIILLKMTMGVLLLKYGPCVNYPNDKVYLEDEKNGWLGFRKYWSPKYI